MILEGEWGGGLGRWGGEDGMRLGMSRVLNNEGIVGGRDSSYTGFPSNLSCFLTD